MKRLLCGFVLGIMVGAGGYWYLAQGGGGRDFAQAKQRFSHEAIRLQQAIRETVSEIRADEIGDELARTSMVVREKAKRAGDAIADAAANARTTASIKAKLVSEPGLSALNINVDTTDGLVTLSGTVSSHDEIAKAVKLALDTDGVHKVVSTIQIKPKR
jgi:osmotically-inducible protein OsmY